MKVKEYIEELKKLDPEKEYLPRKISKTVYTCDNCPHAGDLICCHNCPNF